MILNTEIRVSLPSVIQLYFTTIRRLNVFQSWCLRGQGTGGGAIGKNMDLNILFKV